MKHRDWHRAWAGLCPPSLHPGYVLVWATGGGGRSRAKQKNSGKGGESWKKKQKKYDNGDQD